MQRSFSRSTIVWFGIASAAVLAVACGEATESDSLPGDSFTATGATGGLGGGGRQSVGSSTGGIGTSSGGSTGVGGSFGASATGGTTTSSGGSVATGGRASAGGSSAASGGVATGGAPNTGGSAGKATSSTGGASSGGSAGKGGAAAGGTSGRAGAPATGGTSSGGKASAGAGNVPAIGPGPCGCETTAGEFGTVDETIVVEAGKTYDGACKIYRANPSTLGAGNQDEDQKPVFRVEDGAALRNVVIGASAADGVHIHGDATLENIHWLDIGEDAMTIKEPGTVHLNCGSAAHGEDKIFQVNAESDITITNFTATDGGKFMRQNGDTTFKMTVTIDHCDISNIDEVIYRTDSSTSHVTLTNTRYSKLGDGLFRFGDRIVNGPSGQSSVSNNQQY